jgi:hypothetical protein
MNTDMKGIDLSLDDLEKEVAWRYYWAHGGYFDPGAVEFECDDHHHDDGINAKKRFIWSTSDSNTNEIAIVTSSHNF